jgi:hypothetical protein
MLILFKFILKLPYKRLNECFISLMSGINIAFASFPEKKNDLVISIPLTNGFKSKYSFEYVCIYQKE